MYQSPWDLPEPPSEDPRRASVLRIVVTAAVLLGLMVATVKVPIPIYYAYLPGPTRNISKLVDVQEGKVYTSAGKLLMTTVSVDTEVTAIELIAAAIDKNKDIVRSEEVTGGAPLDQIRDQQVAEMQASKQAAREVALAALGFGQPEGDGAVVEGTLEGFDAHETLLRGDLIVAIDGEEIETTCDVGRLIDLHEPGDSVEVTIVRDGVRQSFELEAGVNPEDGVSALIGVSMSDVNYRFAPSVRVRFTTGDIAGPSAGLMFSLALYDQLTPDDLTGGKVVAGTGTIACDGGVGPIGGIEEKVAGAERDGAEIFLAPRANAEAAKGAAGDIEVVPIGTFSEAVEYLEGLSQSP
ncbi:MAG TPA: S16 family serine protease [Actinomycetota bacterium]|nr:S16 family serine protease [Actinomycetota bacterium]